VRGNVVAISTLSDGCIRLKCDRQQDKFVAFFIEFDLFFLHWFLCSF
jgi:hypothetical protein